MLQLLCFNSDEDVRPQMLSMGTDYCGDDFVNRYLRPMNLWLRTDVGEGAAERQARFHQAVLGQWQAVSSSASRRHCVPLFLEAISVTDDTEIWMEAIRLNGQGFRVEVSPECTGRPASPVRKAEHHLIWCGNGISKNMYDAFLTRLERGDTVMLTGHDLHVR